MRHMPTYLLFSGCDYYPSGGADDLVEVCPWPGKRNESVETLDWSDPCSGRLVIKTNLGDIFLDKRDDGINCFCHTEDGKRKDVLLFPSKEGG